MAPENKLSTTLLCLALLGGAFAVGVGNPVVDLGYTKYRGIYSESEDISRFLGIRYAAPITANLRWIAPRPPLLEPGIQNATTRASHCLQAHSGTNSTNPFTDILSPRQLQPRPDSEDCLFLSVNAPGYLDSTRSLPVIVWIHGGGYLSMYPNQEDGADLVKISKGRVVVVTIQYRLGIFGFLAGSQTKKNGALNVGLLDQEFALKWVQKYIPLFGGDPKKVTIWGESAGAGSVLQHVISRNGQQVPSLYRSAILSSSFLPSQYNYNDPVPEFIYQQVVNQVGCATSAETLSCLRKADATALQEANIAINNAGFYGTWVTVPVIDGDFITQSVTRSLQQRKLNTKSVLAITNTNEGNLFVDQKNAGSFSVSEYARLLFPLLSQQVANKVEFVYSGTDSSLARINKLHGDAIFTCPTYYLLKSLGGRGYKGEYAVLPADHGNDVAYYLPTGTFNPPFNDPTFIKAFSQSFLNFVISGDPNIKFDRDNITPTWPLWKDSHAEMVFNRTADSRPDIATRSTDATLEERCRFWGTLTGWTAQ